MSELDWVLSGLTILSMAGIIGTYSLWIIYSAKGEAFEKLLKWALGLAVLGVAVAVFSIYLDGLA